MEETHDWVFYRDNSVLIWAAPVPLGWNRKWVPARYGLYTDKYKMLCTLYIAHLNSIILDSHHTHCPPINVYSCCDSWQWNSQAAANVNLVWWCFEAAGEAPAATLRGCHALYQPTVWIGERGNTILLKQTYKYFNYITVQNHGQVPILAM